MQSLREFRKLSYGMLRLLITRLVGLIRASMTYIAPRIKAFCLRLDFT